MIGLRRLDNLQTCIEDVLRRRVPGDLIETRGEAVGNPLEQILDLMAQILPYLGLDEESLGKAATRTPSKQAKRSGNPAKAAEAAALEAAEAEAVAEARQQAEGMLLALRMRTDLESATVKDSVLLADDGLRTVMTLSTEFFAEQTAQYLHAGEFLATCEEEFVEEQSKLYRIAKKGAK